MSRNSQVSPPLRNARPAALARILRTAGPSPLSGHGVVINSAAPLPYDYDRKMRGAFMPKKLPTVLVGFFAAGLAILAVQALVKLF